MGQAVRAIDPDEFSAPFLGVSRSAKGLIWRERLDAKDQSTAVAISQRFDLPELLGRVLAGRGVAVDDFINTHNIDAKKLFNFVKKGNLKDRMAFVGAIAGRPNNKMFKMITKQFGESVINEGYSTEEKRIVMMAVRKLSKYRSVPIDQSINDLLGAGAELQRDIKRGKIKK